MDFEDYFRFLQTYEGFELLGTVEGSVIYIRKALHYRLPGHIQLTAVAISISICGAGCRISRKSRTTVQFETEPVPYEEVLQPSYFDLNKVEYNHTTYFDYQGKEEALTV